MYQSLSEEHADGRDRAGELEPEHSEAARDQELNAEPLQAHNQPALPLDRPQEPASSCAKSATLRFVSATPLLAILSLLITCFATAYPHWVTYAGSNGYIGLWRYCYSNAGEDEVCSEIGDSHCAHSGCGVIDGLRALMVLAILFNALVLLLSAAYYFWPPSPYSQADCDHLCCFFRFCERPHTGGEESLEADLALLLEVHGPAAIQQPARLAAILVQSRALLHGDEPRPWSALLPTYYPRCLQQLASLLQALCLFFALCLSPVQLAWWAQAQPDAPVHVGACPLVTIVPLLLSAGYSAALFIALRRWRAFSVQPFPQAHLLLPNALAAAGAAALGPPVQVAEVA